MGFAEIQAAFAAQGQAPASAAVTASPAFMPSPFAQPAAAPAAPTQTAFAFTPPTAPSQPALATPAFAFTPPAGAPGPFAPINPPGERAPLAAPPVEAPAPTPTPELVVEPKPKRTRKAKAEPVAPAADNLVNQEMVSATMFDRALPPECAEVLTYDPAGFAKLAADLKDLPADGSTVEDIVEELFARGVSQVNLTFTRGAK